MYKFKKILALAFCLVLMLVFIACKKENLDSSSESSSSDIVSNESSDESSSESEHVHIAQTLAGYEPTCTEAGLTEGKKCSECGEILVQQETIKAKGHTEETLE